MKIDVGDYFWEIRDCNSSATDIQEKRLKKKLEKSASYIKSITEMFLVQHNWNRLHHFTSLSAFLLSPSLSKNSAYPIVKNMETQFEFQT